MADPSITRDVSDPAIVAGTSNTLTLIVSGLDELAASGPLITVRIPCRPVSVTTSQWQWRRRVLEASASIPEANAADGETYLLMDLLENVQMTCEPPKSWAAKNRTTPPAMGWQISPGLKQPEKINIRITGFKALPGPGTATVQVQIDYRDQRPSFQSDIRVEVKPANEDGGIHSFDVWPD